MLEAKEKEEKGKPPEQEEYKEKMEGNYRAAKGSGEEEKNPRYKPFPNQAETSKEENGEVRGPENIRVKEEEEVAENKGEEIFGPDGRMMD